MWKSLSCLAPAAGAKDTASTQTFQEWLRLVPAALTLKKLMEVFQAFWSDGWLVVKYQTAIFYQIQIFIVE